MPSIPCPEGAGLVTPAHITDGFMAVQGFYHHLRGLCKWLVSIIAALLLKVTAQHNYPFYQGQMHSQEMRSRLSSLASFGMGPGTAIWGDLIQGASGTPQDR